PGLVGFVAKFIRHVPSGGTVLKPDALIVEAIQVAPFTTWHPYAIVRMSTGVSTSGMTGGGLNARASCRKSYTCGADSVTGGAGLLPLIRIFLPVARLTPAVWCVT